MSTGTNEDISFLAALKPRERKLAEAIAFGEGYTWAMKLAGYAHSTAIKQQARTRNKPRIDRAIHEIWYREGLPLTRDELAMIGKKKDDRELVQLNYKQRIEKLLEETRIR